MSTFVRHIRLCKPPPTHNPDRAQPRQAKLQLELRDVFTVGTTNVTIAENFITECAPTIEDGVVWLAGQRAQCSIEIENKDKITAKIVPCAHKGHAGNCQTVYRIVWEFSAAANEALCCKVWITFYDRDVKH
ncbi:MAG: hypothetical protein K2P63_03805 [Lachnospiraceae bacterium]|nr:hypothetical protein [Lachnospiraceae bacterium]